MNLDSNLYRFLRFAVQVVEEVGRHITFRYEGVLPLADQDLLALLDILVNKADIMQVLFLQQHHFGIVVVVPLQCRFPAIVPGIA